MKATKKEVIKNLERKIKEETNITKEKQLRAFKRLVNSCNIEYFEASITKNKHYNIGDIGEKIVLSFLGLTKEDKDHEIKTLCCNYPNLLTNPTIKTVYILIVNNNPYYKNGLYRCDAKHIYKKDLSKKVLRNLKLEKIANLKELATPATKKIVVNKMIEKNISVKEFNHLIKLLTFETSKANREVMKLVLD
jgi:hypothetical protein